MGIALWMLCGAAVFVASRAISVARPPSLIGELSVAILISFVAGLAASALDFGGWGEVDWRAAAFVICCTLAAIGGMRLLRLFRRRVSES